MKTLGKSVQNKGFYVDICCVFIVLYNSKNLCCEVLPLLGGSGLLIDIHCHILYGVDDGSGYLEESIEMVKVAMDGGTNAIIATPHCNIVGEIVNHWCDIFDKKINEMNGIFQRENVPMIIYPGHEIYCDDEGEFLKLIKNEKLITLNRSRYALVEFEFHESADSVYKKIGLLSAEGLVPIMAHPERYDFVSEDKAAIERLKKTGCLFQLNKASLTGGFGRQAHHNAFYMLENELADFVASDGHSPYKRTPYMGEADEIISEEFSPDYADLLMDINPRKVINDEII